MRSLTYKRVFDRTILETVVTHYTSLASTKSLMLSSYRQYVIKKGSPSIIPLTLSSDQIADFEKAYNNKPVGAGLDWINEIYINGLNSCPLCGGDGARTIEHYLPQTSYPEFSVFSLNLLPSCGSCNSKRNSLNAHGATISPLHPYFDKKILEKLNVYTSVSLDCGIVGFDLTYDRTPFNADEQLRIDHHIEISLDQISYINRTLASIESLRISAEKYSSVENFRTDAIEDEIYKSDKMKDTNSWHHALCKGLAALPDADLHTIFSDCFGLRTKNKQTSASTQD